LVENPADVGAVLADTLELVAKIRGSQTSRTKQRAVYDAHFAPDVVAQRWFSYLEGGVGATDETSLARSASLTYSA
jgi:hypothetical protein